MTTLTDIAKQIEGCTIIGEPNTDVCRITHDSRQVSQGTLFAAIKGQTVDGTAFVDKAIAAGATAVLCEAPLSTEIPQLIVSSVREQLGYVAAACYGHPSEALKLIGITGTNGKTTITYLVESILRDAGIGCGVMGTIEYRYGARYWHADHTTPESTVVQETMREMVNAGAQALAMEVSSHGISLGRLHGCVFDVVAFTNLTQDHLDFHETMEAYGETKKQLFTTMIAEHPDARAVINVDDAFGKRILKDVTHSTLSVSCDISKEASIHPTKAPIHRINGLEAEIATPEGNVVLNSPLCGTHNLSNLLVAFGICLSLGVSKTAIAASIAKIQLVPGRLERVPCDLGFSVFVDYAHTPDALVNVLRALKPLTSGRLICVFGCGGDRDGAKRPLMGEAVAKYADIAVVTSDNPRTEDPDAIIDMVIPGMVPHNPYELTAAQLASSQRGYVRMTDRREAIAASILAAKEEDTVLIAGKGHEDYVIIGKQKLHFDDREEAAAALASRKG